MPPPGLRATKKDATVLSADDFGMMNDDSGDDVDGIDATPNISKGKVQHFLNFNAQTTDGAEIPKISSSSAKKTAVGSTATIID
jgi:hypothetical protein